MKAKLHHALSVIGLLGLSLSSGGLSEARTLPAFAGQPQNPAYYSSFVNNAGRVVQYSGTNKTYCVSLPADGGLTGWIYVTAKSPDVNHRITCQGVAVTKEGGIYSTTSWSGPSSYNVDQQVYLGSVSVPTDGALYTCCNMATTSTWDTVQYFNY